MRFDNDIVGLLLFFSHFTVAYGRRKRKETIGYGLLLVFCSLL